MRIAVVFVKYVSAVALHEICDVPADCVACVRGRYFEFACLDDIAFCGRCRVDGVFDVFERVTVFIRAHQFDWVKGNFDLRDVARFAVHPPVLVDAQFHALCPGVGDKRDRQPLIARGVVLRESLHRAQMFDVFRTVYLMLSYGQFLDIFVIP